jgi:putative membrane protein
MSKTAWIAIGIGVALLVVLVIASVLIPFNGGRGYGYGWGMMGPSMMGGFGFPFFGGIAMLLFWVLVIGGVVWLVQSLARGGGMTGVSAPPESPLDILKRRYARSEITKEQFESMRHDLNA